MNALKIFSPVEMGGRLNRRESTRRQRTTPRGMTAVKRTITMALYDQVTFSALLYTATGATTAHLAIGAFQLSLAIIAGTQAVLTAHESQLAGIMDAANLAMTTTAEVVAAAASPAWPPH